MTAFIIIVTVLLIGCVAAGLILYFHSRRTLREQKNYERALKMVPLQIHLPPLSDDIDGSSRDVRDVTDENISKAQVLYNIIASTVQKGFKSKFYGQRHVSFEIIGTKGFVYFYTAVPVVLVDVVRQAVVSAYPTARLEEVAEHNIFSPVGKLSGTIGGELVLKENYAYPIATYQDLKRDALQSILNALSTLDKEDGAGIQILIRPAPGDWRKKASALAGKKRKGKDKGKKGAAVLNLAKQVAVAPVKAPEDKKDKPDDKHELSSLEQSVVDAMDDKTRYPGFETQIRVIASSNISSRAQSILSNVTASFALFDSPGKNGFKYVPAKDIESFVTAYIMRFFPQENTSNILNAVELATLFHFPDQKNIPTSQLERQASKQVDGPRNISESGLALGYNIFRGTKKRINLSPEDRARHVYIVGQTGTGKSTILENMALQDMLNGNGFAFIDPHGDVAEKLLSMVPKERTEDVIYFSPADMDFPLGLNLFEYDNPDQKDFLIQETINMLYKLYDPQRQGIIGPRYEHLFRNAALTVMADPEGGTFIDIPKLFNDEAFVKQKLKYVTDDMVRDFWLKEMPASSRSSEFGEVKSWFVSKFGAFLSNQMMRNIIGQPKSAFNLRDIMDNKKILLVNLSKGRTGELNSKLLGMIFVMKFQAAAMSRATLDEDKRVDFSLYVDEFQNFSTDSFATILSEARKYHLNLIVANQFTTQLSDEIRDAVFGNVGTIISYRVGTNDAEFLAKYFAPVFDINDLQRVPNFNAIVRMMIGGVPSQPFSMAGLPPLGQPNKELADALKQLSAAKFGKPKAQVESAIFSRLKTHEPARPGLGQAQPGGFGSPAAMGGAGGYAQPGMPPAAPQQPASFMDEWMTKRAKPMQARPNPWNKPAAQAPSGAPNAGMQQAGYNTFAQPASQPFGPPSPTIPAPGPTTGQPTLPAQPTGDPATSLGTNQPYTWTPPNPPAPSSPSPMLAPASAPASTQPSYQLGGSTQPQSAVQGGGPLEPMNISSNGLDKQEVSHIAQELRQGLQHDAPPTPSASAAPQAPASNSGLPPALAPASVSVPGAGAAGNGQGAIPSFAAPAAPAVLAPRPNAKAMAEAAKAEALANAEAQPIVAAKSGPSFEDSDTIFIDAEGNFQQKPEA